VLRFDRQHGRCLVRRPLTVRGTDATDNHGLVGGLDSPDQDAIARMERQLIIVTDREPTASNGVIAVLELDENSSSVVDVDDSPPPHLFGAVCS
jgi:hypothetical protein